MMSLKSNENINLMIVSYYYCKYWFNRIDEFERIIKTFPSLAYSIGSEGVLESL